MNSLKQLRRRRKVTIQEVRAYAKECGIQNADELSICALYGLLQKQLKILKEI